MVEKIFQTQKEIDDLNAEAQKKGARYYQRRSTAPGDYKYKDINNDGKIDQEDKTYLGSAQPDFFGGFSTSLQYKQFKLSTYFNYSVGAKRRIDHLQLYYQLGKNVTKEFADRWTTTNTDAKYARITPSPDRSDHDKSVFDASYMRLKMVTLSYTLPPSILDNIKLDAVRFSISATNLWTLTKFPGLDPEALTSGGGGAIANVANNSNNSFYPTSREWIFGIDVSF